MTWTVTCGACGFEADADSATEAFERVEAHNRDTGHDEITASASGVGR